jgi:hypothetical protein
LGARILASLLDVNSYGYDTGKAGLMRPNARAPGEPRRSALLRTRILDMKHCAATLDEISWGRFSGRVTRVIRTRKSRHPVAEVSQSLFPYADERSQFVQFWDVRGVWPSGRGLKEGNEPDDQSQMKQPGSHDGPRVKVRLDPLFENRIVEYLHDGIQEDTDGNEDLRLPDSANSD